MLPAASAASSTPPVPADPRSSANAGIVTSSVPNASPKAALTTSRVRTPGEASAPSRCSGPRLDPRGPRRPVAAKASVPAAVTTATNASAACGEATATSNATSSGPEMKNASCTIASNANAVAARSSLPARRVSSARVAANSGG